LRRDVPLGHPGFGVAVRCQCKREEDEARAARRAAKASNLTEEMRMLTFDSYVPSSATRAAWEAMRAFAERPEGWLVLVGGVGSGKTHLLAACANVLLAGGRHHPLYVVVPDFLDYLRAAYDDGESDSDSSGYRADISERMRQAIQADVLLLDDLGAEKRTVWTDERLYMVLNARYNAGAPTVVATNLPPDAETGAVEERIASRLRDRALSRVLVLVSEDFRLRDRPRRSRSGSGSSRKSAMEAATEGEVR
jgi:DNA replication protein DnaC